MKIERLSAAALLALSLLSAGCKSSTPAPAPSHPVTAPSKPLEPTGNKPDLPAPTE